MPCVGRVERPEQHRAREGGWASNESHEQPKPKTNATAKPTESRSNRTANGSRPESKKHIDRHWNITPPNTHTHTHTTQAKAAGRARRALRYRGVLYKAQQRARGPGTAGSSEVGCGMAGVAGQWRHAGHNVGKKDAAGLMHCAPTAALAVV